MLLSRMNGKSQAPAAEQPPAPQTVEDYLVRATPKAAELYNRFAELVQTFGQVSIVPTQTRVDFRFRTIFASVEFREDSLLITMPSSVPGCKRPKTWVCVAYRLANGLYALGDISKLNCRNVDKS